MFIYSRKLFYGVIMSISCLPVYAQEITEIENILIESQNREDKRHQNVAPLETHASVIILTKDELQGVAGTQGDPLKALSTLPGIVNAYSSSGAGLNNGFYVRGSNSNENTIWIDGLPVGYMFHLGGLYSIVNPDLISEFDTYLGGFGVEYGDKLGGAINVQTKDPRSDLTEHSAQIGFFDSSYRVEGPISENSSGYFAVRRSYLDLFMPATGSLGNSDINYTQFPQFWDLQAKWQYQLANGFVDFNILTSNDKLTLNVDNRGDILQDPAIAGYRGGEDAFQTYGIRWHQNLNNNWKQKIRFPI